MAKNIFEWAKQSILQEEEEEDEEEEKKKKKKKKKKKGETITSQRRKTAKVETIQHRNIESHSQEQKPTSKTR